MARPGDGLVVFLYEFMAAGGTFELDLDGAACDSLLREGAAMLRALIEDFAAVPAVRVVAMYNHHLAAPDFPDVDYHFVGTTPEERQMFRRLAAEADFTLVVAPEINGILLERSRIVESVGGKLLSAGIEAVQVGSDKNLTANRWETHGVPHPPGAPVEPGQTCSRNVRFPAILKPVDGAGSIGLRRIQRADQWNEMPLPRRRMRLESFCAGLPASLAVLNGSTNRIALPAFIQRFDESDAFTYLGGQLLVDAELQHRARDLAMRAASAVETATGYLGVDIVLGDDPGGTNDVAIELNPRITTSYIGLRQAVDCNMAEILLDLAIHDTCHRIPRIREPVEFFSDGTVITSPSNQV